MIVPTASPIFNGNSKLADQPQANDHHATGSAPDAPAKARSCRRPGPATGGADAAVAPPRPRGQAPALEPLVIGPDQLAELLSVNRSTVDRWDSAGIIGPIGHKLGGRRLYRLDEVMRWIEAGLPPRDEWLARQQTKKKSR